MTMDNDQQKALLAAASFFNEIAKKRLTTERGLHAETLIMSVARLSGSLMYKSFGLDDKLAPGTTVLSEQANQHGPKLMDMMLVTLQQLGQPITEATVDTKYLDAKFSQLSFQESYERLAPFFLAYCQAAPLTFREAAIAGAVATGILIQECRTVLPVAGAAALGIYGFIEGTKTVPY